MKFADNQDRQKLSDALETSLVSLHYLLWPYLPLIAKKRTLFDLLGTRDFCPVGDLSIENDLSEIYKTLLRLIYLYFI